MSAITVVEPLNEAHESVALLDPDGKPLPSTLRALVDLYKDVIQRTRIGFNNRLAALANAQDDPSTTLQAALVRRWLQEFETLEKKLVTDIKLTAKSHPMYQPLCDVKGISTLLAAPLLVFIDIERCNTVSSLWRYAGLGVKDGRAERRTKGEKLAYNSRLKTHMFLIATSFLRTRREDKTKQSPYVELYDRARERYNQRIVPDATGPDAWTPSRAHMAAMRVMVKVFLAHLWFAWREQRGLSTRPLYVEEKLGHTTIEPRENYGWKI